MIPMRDGVKLFTIVLRARRCQTGPSRSDDPLAVRERAVRPGRLPPLARPVTAYEKNGYIFLYQDVRGRYRSGGEGRRDAADAGVAGPTMSTSSTDTYDTTRLAVKSDLRHKRPRGLWGCRMRCFYAAAALPRAHRRSKACHRHGADSPISSWATTRTTTAPCMLAANFSLLLRFVRVAAGPRAATTRRASPTTPRRLRLLSRARRPQGGQRAPLPAGQHLLGDNLDPPPTKHWKPRAIAPHVREVTPAVLTVGGWFDARTWPGRCASTAPSSGRARRRRTAW